MNELETRKLFDFNLSWTSPDFYRPKEILFLSYTFVLQYFITGLLTAVRQEVNTLGHLVVVQELESTILRVLYEAKAIGI